MDVEEQWAEGHEAKVLNRHWAADRGDVEPHIVVRLPYPELVPALCGRQAPWLDA